MTLYGTGSNPVVEIMAGGSWGDGTHRVRADDKVTITRGRLNEQGTVSAQIANLSLNNADGVLSNRNPNSPFYGLLPRNTQIRITAGAGDNYLKLIYSDNGDGNAFNDVFTADKASLDIVGDIDVRAEIWPASWRPIGHDMTVMAKYALTGNQRSWVLYFGQTGTLSFGWSTDGTLAGRTIVTSTAAVPASAGHLAIRATLDVNNGAAML